MQAAINAATSSAVKIWMNWMLAIFVLSIVFVWNHKTARVIFGAFLLTLPLAMYIFNITGLVPLLGLAHIIVWVPLAIYLIIDEVMRHTFEFKTPYGIYVVLLLVTIIISLFFDIRDSIPILLGMK